LKSGNFCIDDWPNDDQVGRRGQKLSLEPASKQTATHTFQVELIPDGVSKEIQHTGQPLELQF
tara:strand:- start:18 stop:206 length:189 start_codon:yes stop_codon:yes gene_type:complete